jgi:electron transfer flavoprotein beta subunit
MKIVACIKYSLDVSEVKVDAATRQLRLTGTPRKLGNIDKNVLETAASLKEAHGGTVHVVTFGPPEARNALKEALGMNADDATLVVEPEHANLDTGATAEVLVAFMERMGGCDLVVCGEASDDGFTFQVGPRVAERLGIPQVTYARKVAIEHGYVVAERDRGDAVEVVRAPLPALLTVTEETNTPRRPTLMDLLKARKKPLLEWSLDHLGLSRQGLENASMLQLLSTEGIVVERRQVALKDRPATELANEVVDRLLQDEVLERPGE